MSSASLEITKKITLGDIIELCRHEHGWTAEQLARRANVPVAAVVTAERNPAHSKTMDLVRIAEALRVDLFEAYRRVMAHNQHPDTNPSRRTAHVRPLITGSQTILQSVMFFDSHGTLLDYEDHAPNFSIVTSEDPGKYVGTRIMDLHHIRNAVGSARNNLMVRIKERIFGAQQNISTLPYRYQAYLTIAPEVLTTRELRVERQSYNVYKSSTCIVADEITKPATPCCRGFSNCQDCFRAFARKDIHRKVS